MSDLRFAKNNIFYVASAFAAAAAAVTRDRLSFMPSNKWVLIDLFVSANNFWGL